MPVISKSTCVLPYHAPVPLTRLPLVFHRDHLFPYTSYGDTLADATTREVNVLVLENMQVRVTVCPDLGGRVLGYFDKSTGRELLFANPVIKPVRILPIWAFISGGIEFNFPIAHSPTSIDPVGFSTGTCPTAAGEYAFIRVGEREARTGMEWVVELGLLGENPALIQRTALRNQTTRDHPWMLWTNCAVPSTPETEFVYPPGPVLRHDTKVTDIDWPTDGCQWEKNIKGMTGFFWKPGEAIQFGVYHHDTNSGLIHIADPARIPGKKLWTYGPGPDRAWAQASTDGTLSYCEIQSGPLGDQSEKPMFPAGGELHFEEYWLPARDRGDFDNPVLPNFPLPDWKAQQPWLGHAHSAWQLAWEEFRDGGQRLPDAPVPTGLELEPSLRLAGPAAAEHLALWLIGRDRAREALPLVENLSTPTAQRLAGMIQWKVLKDPQRAVVHLRHGPLHDPVAVAEFDEVLAALNLTVERRCLLADAPPHRLVTERLAHLALATGHPEETLRLLAESPWPLEHQRYVRGELWHNACLALGRDPAIPASLGEDSLAGFGAYWSE